MRRLCLNSQLLMRSRRKLHEQSKSGGMEMDEE